MTLSNNNIAELLTWLVQIKIWHWQVRGVGSEAAHEALGELYDTLSSLIDELVELDMGTRCKVPAVEKGEFPTWPLMGVPKDNDLACVLEPLLFMFQEKLSGIGATGAFENKVQEMEAAVATARFLLSLK